MKTIGLPGKDLFLKVSHWLLAIKHWLFAGGAGHCSLAIRTQAQDAVSFERL